MPVTPPVLGQDAIVPAFSRVYVPAANFDAYKASWGESNLALLEED
jgi:hypothetical protein